MSEASSSPSGVAHAAGLSRLEVVIGDITRASVDAIVNAANEALAGGGGVDGAIHAAAGVDELVRACRALPEVRPGVRCPTGEARITPGFRLPARHIIHTVGPVWHGGQQREAELLAACYTSSVELARAHQLSTLAFPAISTGVFGYPLDAACRVAVNALGRALDAAPSIARVSLFAFGEPTARALGAAVAREVVTAWLDAGNVADVGRITALTAPDIEIVGPRGSARGREVLIEWLGRAGARFETLGVSSQDDQVVVEQHGVWRTPDGAVQGEARVACRFVVHRGQVQLVQRYDSLAAAHSDAGIRASS
jgi:O-acetyl-ADP-ribose deacetylase